MSNDKIENDDIGEEKRLEIYRLQLECRYIEKRAYDLFLQNLVKGTSHLGLGQEAIAAGFGGWLEAASKRLHRCVLVVALANKLARIAWSVLNRGRAYEASA